MNPLATGFCGAVFDGASIYLAPCSNGGPVDKGLSAITARFTVGDSFTSAGSWSTFDLTTVNGLAYQFVGAGFDGRYVYFAPRGAGIVVRFDTAAGKLGAAGAWSTYDVSRVVPRPTVATPSAQYAGVAFDGRFITFVPTGTSFATVVRYDTRSTFTADCAWSTADLTPIDAGGVVPQNFNGAVFDGEYLYLIPNSNGLFARFRVKTPAALPALPAFNGSFW